MRTTALEQSTTSKWPLCSSASIPTLVPKALSLPQVYRQIKVPFQQVHQALLHATLALEQRRKMLNCLSDHKLKVLSQGQEQSVILLALPAPGHRMHAKGRRDQPTSYSPNSRSYHACLGSHCPEHLPTNCPPHTHAVGPSQEDEGGEGQLNRQTHITHRPQLRVQQVPLCPKYRHWHYCGKPGCSRVYLLQLGRKSQDTYKSVLPLCKAGPSFTGSWKGQNLPQTLWLSSIRFLLLWKQGCILKPKLALNSNLCWECIGVSAM